MRIKKNTIICALLCMCIAATVVLAGCGSSSSSSSNEETTAVTTAATVDSAKTDSIDYGTSKLYTEDELKDAVIQIKCKFAFWGDVDLKSIRYAGDEKATDEMLKKMNEINPDGKYTQVAEFLMDFHTPTEVGELTLTADRDYTDYQWWLARTADGGWEIVTFGYG